VSEKATVRPCHAEVVDLNWNDGEHALDKRGAARPPPRAGEFDADKELGDGHGGDGDVVLVADQLVEREMLALGCDEDRRVEDQAVQRLSSIRSAERSARSSSVQPASRGWARRASLTAAPCAAGAGPTRATGRPLRTTTNVSPCPSTASSISENRRAASVAVNLFIRIRLSEISRRRQALAHFRHRDVSHT
jgi:hypothetical protein